MKIKKLIIVSCLLMGAWNAGAQDLGFVRQIIDSLSAERYQGRGYVNRGDRLAAGFLVEQMKKIGLQAIDGQYFQYYDIDINTFPGKMGVKLDKTPLKAGADFVIGSSSPGIRGSYKTYWVSHSSLDTEDEMKAFLSKNLKNSVVVIDTGFKEMDIDKLYSGKAVLVATKGLAAFDVSEGRALTSYAAIYVPREKIPENLKKVSLDIENVYIDNYRSQNVIGYLPGTVYPDSFLVFTAHYDHLGKMGSEVYFPGAHDNASGCAMLLDLASYYAREENRPECSVAFIFFSGEEAGLLGSRYFSDHPVFPLKKIRFLINLDMVTTGSEGIKVVNGSVLKDEFELLVRLNKENNLLKTVSPRGEAPNSDHYWLYKKGVKSIFIYTLGPEWKEYHNVKDVSDGLPMTEYEDLFRLLTLFVAELR